MCIDKKNRKKYYIKYLGLIMKYINTLFLFAFAIVTSMEALSMEAETNTIIPEVVEDKSGPEGMYLVRTDKDGKHHYICSIAILKRHINSKEYNKDEKITFIILESPQIYLDEFITAGKYLNKCHYK
jgi:hypothetical protein